MARVFNGVDAWLQCTMTGALDDLAPPFTLMGRASVDTDQPNTDGQLIAVGRNPTNTNSNYRIQQFDIGEFDAGMPSSGAGNTGDAGGHKFSHGGSFPFETPTVFTGVFADLGSPTHFINSTKYGPNTSGTSTITPSNVTTLRIGARHNAASLWKGKVYWIAVWRRALTDGEVTAIAGGADPTSYTSSLVAHWSFSTSSLLDSVNGFTLANTNTSWVSDTPDPAHQYGSALFWAFP